jgi:hypothetical protein
MLPKSRRHIYLGFDDGTKAVKYYNAETQKILTSHNFHNINPPPETPPEPIIITPSEQPEEEPGKKDMPLLGTNDSHKNKNQDPPNKQKWKMREEETSVDINEPCKTRGICTDYKQLSNRGIHMEYLEDPFFDEGDNETSLITEEMYAIIAGDELNSLAEAK